MSPLFRSNCSSSLDQLHKKQHNINQLGVEVAIA
uniref:Uncharacterized protein n=1 Tax=Arundo donax TaxID=35708 RepID=A0A0A9EI82_ARUDO